MLLLSMILVRLVGFKMNRYYFICEGAEGKAEYKFLSAIIDLYRTTEECIVLCADGNKHLENKYREIRDSLKSGDRLILFFDNVEKIDGKLVIDLLLDIKTFCQEKGVVFRYTTYYCFEELFLSYRGLFSIIDIRDNDLKNSLSSLQTSIISGDNYFNKDLSFWYNYLKDNKGAFKTREKLSSAILFKLLSSAKGAFKITKAGIGAC